MSITLVCADSVDIERAIDAVEICKHYFKFDKIKLFSDIEYNYKHIIHYPKMNNIIDYNKFMLYDLNDYVDTDYVMICQWDGFILNPDAWMDEFLNYDYIGAPWRFENIVIGNGGFSLRSKKLLEVLQKLFRTNSSFDLRMPEDYVICGYLRETLEKIYNIKFPDVDLADKFSVEDKHYWNGEFGFHGFHKVNIFKDGWEPPKLNYLSDRIKNKIDGNVPGKPKWEES